MAKKYNDDDDDDNGMTEENPEEEKEEELIKEIEFGMTEDKIDEWIAELRRLKEDQGTSVLPIDDKIQLKINYEEELDM